MKNFRLFLTRLFFYLLVILCLSIIGCNKEDKRNPNLKGQISWNINGSSFTADVLAYAARRPISFGNDSEIVIGASTKSENLNISFYPATDTGHFVARGGSPTINTIAVNYAGKNYLANQSINNSNVTLHVTELTNAKVKGTFDGTLLTESGEQATASGAFDIAF